MSISIYYTARREKPLAPAERAAVERIRAAYSVRDQVDRYVRDQRGHNGEDFHVYDGADPTEPGVIFVGATKLPDNGGEDALWAMVQHWCRLLTEARRAVPGARWQVSVDDHEI